MKTNSLPHPLIRIQAILPGVLISLLLGLAATFLSEKYTAPVMLYALLIGLSLNFLSQDQKIKPGIEFSAKLLLRIGVALLGLRITWTQLSDVGLGPFLMLMLMVFITIAFSILIAKSLGFTHLFGLLSGGATAICGASAAMALSAALPNHPLKEKATVFTVIGVSVLSTISMVLYPLLAYALHLSPDQSGFFIGATIHDVAQVVGAGYSMSPEVGDLATVVKMSRVAMLLPVIVLATWFARKGAHNEPEEKPPFLPFFLVMFLVLMGLNSLALIPQPIASAGVDLSKWLLVISMGAIGMKTNIKQIIEVGVRPVILMVIETAFLALAVLLYLKYF